MRKILVAVPVELPINPPIHEKTQALLETLTSAQFELEPVMHYNIRTSVQTGPKYSAHARARNDLIDTHLRDDHEFVLWIDDDIVEYPANVVDLLYVDDNTIVAPTVVVESQPTIFYDTHGFRTLTGEEVSQSFPRFSAEPKHIELAAVGCMYLIPAALYRDGVRYEATPRHTEHWSVMKAARDRGYRVLCDKLTTIYHAYLPRYGEKWH
jgi:hypothetical protein